MAARRDGRTPDADQLKLLAVPHALRVGRLPDTLLHGDKVYTLPLGESFVHDGFVAQLRR